MLVNVPMVLCALALAQQGIADDEPTARSARPDILGGVLATAGMTLLVFGVVRTEQYGWTATATVATLVLAAALLAGFVCVEGITGRDPLVRLGLFANRAVLGANLFILLVGAAMASSFYFVSFYLQQVLGHGPARTGMEFLPLAFAVLLGAVLAVKLGYRCAPRTLLVGGALLTAAGFAWFGLMSPDGSFLTDVLGPSIVVGVGFGQCHAPVASIATIGVPRHESGVASGLVNSSRQIGAALGLAALGTAAAQRTGPSPSPAALNDGYALGMSVAALLLVGAALTALIVPRGGTPTTPDDATRCGGKSAA
jgi:predicted MFS family arabinose efflux permease